MASLQNGGDLQGSITVGNVTVSGGTVDLSSYQTKTDNTLTTTAKTVVGAINENKSSLDTIATTVNNHINNDANIEPSDYDVPKIFFTSDTMLALNSKEDGEVMTEFEYMSKTLKFKSYGTVAIQGTTSATFPKKNYTLKLYVDSGKITKKYINFKDWGSQTKFCLKANYVDTTHTRNLTGARIGYDMVDSRLTSNFKTSLQAAPRNGLVDGFPIKVFVNGLFHGIYTWNIPKDTWQFNNPQMVLCAERNNDGTYTTDDVLTCEFRKAWNGTDGYGWSIEAGKLTTPILNSFNNAINFVATSSDTDFKANISNYFDLYSLLDYYCFSYLCCHYDGLGKNLLMATYDGVIWGASLYDMDSIFGANYNGTTFLETNRQCPEQYQETNSLLWQRIEQCFPNELYTRYKELRKGALSLGNIVSHAEHIFDLITDRDIKEEQDKWSGLPSKSTNTIKRFRDYMQQRAIYVDNEFEVFNATPIPITGLTMNKSTTTVNVGSTDTLSVTYIPTNTTQKGVSWTSSNTNVATVSNGVITGVANGTCTITATSNSNNSIIATCSVTVQTTIISVTGISLNKSTSTLTVSNTEQLTATVLPSNATNKTVIWSTSDNTKATVSATGLVTALASGSVTITATTQDGSMTAICSYTLTQATTLIYELTTPFKGNGTSTYLDTGVKLFDVNKDWTIAVQHLEDATVRTNGSGYWMSCWKETAPVGGLLCVNKIITDPQPNVFIVGSNKQLIMPNNTSNGKTKFVCVLRKSGTTYTVFNNDNNDNTPLTIDGLSINTMQTNLIIGAMHNTDGTPFRFTDITINKLQVFNYAMTDTEMKTKLEEFDV